MSQLARVLCLSILVSCSAAAPNNDPAANGETAEQSIAIGTYNFGTLVSPGKCLDVYAAGSANGTQIQSYTCNGTPAQSFTVKDLGGGVSNIVNTANGKCVDISASGTADGTKVQLWQCNNSGAQSFRILDAGNGNVRIVNTNSNKCLDVAGANPADGTKVHLWSCNGTNAQLWRPAKLATGGGGGGGGTNDGKITTNGYDLLVSGKRYVIRGVGYDPVDVCGWPFAYRNLLSGDADRLRALNVNTIRTYSPLDDTTQLDALWARGIRVIMQVFYNWGDSGHVAAVNRFKNHPAVLAWSVGNEINYGRLGTGNDLNAVVGRVNQVIGEIRSADANHPINVSWGHPGDGDWGYLNALAADMLSFQMYQGLTLNASFGTVFETYRNRGPRKPMWLSEYGADSFRAGCCEDEGMQAHADRVLTELIRNASTQAGAVASGGAVFTFADGWWKAGNPCSQETGGVAPGGGPYLDGVFNEEYWGLMKVNRTPKQAYYAVRDVYATYPQ